jgi:hypothetical protein
VIQRTEGKLWLVIRSEGRLPLEPGADTAFAMAGVNTRVIFNRHRKRAWALALQQDNVTLTGRWILSQPFVSASAGLGRSSGCCTSALFQARRRRVAQSTG